MLFTWVPAFRRHIIRQVAISWSTFALMGVLFWGLPFIVLAIIGPPPEGAHRIFRAYYLIVGTTFGLSVLALWSHGAILTRYRARREEDPRLVESIRKMATRAGLRSVPQLVVMDGRFNAAATWAFATSNVVISAGGVHHLLQDDEEDCVFAHEISHLKHLDIFAKMLIGAGALALALQLLIFVVAWFGWHLVHLSTPEQHAYVGTALAVTVVARFAYELMAAAYSRSREYLADVGAIGILGLEHRDGLISGILRIGSALTEKSPLTLMQRSGWSLFGSHPSPRDRADALRVAVVGVPGLGTVVASIDE